jgi:hypothetical protein
MGMIPSCSPSAAINRTSAARMRSFMRVSAAIENHFPNANEREPPARVLVSTGDSLEAKRSYMARTLEACLPLRPSTMSNSTRCPSVNDL